MRRIKTALIRGGSSQSTSSGTPQPDIASPHTGQPDAASPYTTQPEVASTETRHQDPHDEGIWLIDNEKDPIRRRGRTTCEDIRNLPPGTRVYIEINDDGAPCNILESTLLSSFLGVVARDPTLAPISFKDWRDPGLQEYKKRILQEIEEKFEYPRVIRPYILSSVGIKWKNYKTSLKNAYMNDRPIQDILRNVPERVDALQWAQLVTHWNELRNKERTAQNTLNAQKQKCPHTMGRTSSVRHQQETSVQDRLLLWKMNRVHKNNTWSSEDARLKWELACAMLAESGLTPEDGNVEKNERVFLAVMGPEHPGRVRCKGLGVTPSKLHPQSSSSTTSTGSTRHSFSFARYDELQGEIGGLKQQIGEMQGTQDEMKNTLNQLLKLMTQQAQGLSYHPPPPDDADADAS